MLMTKNSVAHDSVPYFMERFRDAYTTQLQNFAQNVQQDRPAPITIDDGMEALRIGVAATRAHDTGRSVVVSGDQGLRLRSEEEPQRPRRPQRSCGLGSRCDRVNVWRQRQSPRSDVPRVVQAFRPAVGGVDDVTRLSAMRFG